MKSNTHIVVFYDRSLRLWTALLQDEEGNQICDAGYSFNKNNAIIDLKYQADLAGVHYDENDSEK